MEAVFPIIFAVAMAAERFTSGRGKELATQAMMIWYADTAPMGILVSSVTVQLYSMYTIQLQRKRAYRNIAKNLAPVFVVAVTMIHPAMLTSIKAMIWRPRSFIRPDVQVTINDTKNVPIQTGAVMSNVSILP